MKKINLLIVIFLTVVLTSFGQTTVTFFADKDATLREAYSGQNYGSEEIMFVGKDIGGSPSGVARSVLHFDISSLPANAHIESAIITLYGARHYVPVGTTNKSFLYNMTSPWNESSVTWASHNGSYTTYNGVYIPGTAIGHSSTDKILNITNIVQGWVDNPSNNFGLLMKLIDEGPSGFRIMSFLTRENQAASLKITYSQCVEISPNKDALLYSYSANNNYGTHTDFNARSWTRGGTPENERSVLAADLTSIPTNAIVTSAELIFTAYNSPSKGQHSCLTNQNTSTLFQLASSWNETTVTWNNAPSTTGAGIAVGAECSNINFPTRTYDNNTFKSWVQNWVTNPSQNNGVLLKVDTETRYRSLVFASSDNANTAIRPKLNICYYVPSSSIKSFRKSNIVNSNTEVNINPNPTNGQATILLNGFDMENTSVEIFNVNGQLVKSLNPTSNYFKVDLMGQSPGVYVVKIFDGKQVKVKKLLVN